MTMTDTVTNRAAPAQEVEHLRELVLDLGEAVTRLTAELGQLRGRLEGRSPVPAPRPGELHVIPGGAS
jgi:hypothetical protein